MRSARRWSARGSQWATVLALSAATAVTACGRIGYDGTGEDGNDGVPDGAAPDVDGPRPVDATPGSDAIAEADAAPPDPPPDAAGALACGVSIVCDGFDSDIAGWSTRGAVEPRTSFDLVTAPVIEGAGALRFRADVDSGVLWMIEQRFAPISAGTIHGRAMLWVDGATTFDDYLVVLQVDNGDDSGAEKVSLDLLPGDRIRLIATTAEPAAQPTSAAAAVTRDAWMCLRFTIGVANSGGTVRLTRDDTVLATASGIDTRPEPWGFVRFMIGVAAPRQATSEVVFDGVALGSQPLPCP